MFRATSNFEIAKSFEQNTVDCPALVGHPNWGRVHYHNIAGEENIAERFHRILSKESNVMRRCTSLLLTAFALAAPLAGQSRVTLRAGANVATISGADVKSESRVGLNLGASLLIPISDNIGIQLGGAYSAKGAEERFTEISGVFGAQLNCIEVPALLKMEIPSTGLLARSEIAKPREQNRV